MNLRRAIRESYIINFFLLIKRLAANSFLFSIKDVSKTNNSGVKKYWSWSEYSLIYTLMMKLDNFFKRFERFIYDSFTNSKIYNIIFGHTKKNRKKPGIFDNSIFNNSKVFKYFVKLKERLGLKEILLFLAVGYIFVDEGVRSIGFLSILAPIWDELLLIVLFAYIIYMRISSRGTLDYNFTPMGLPAAIFILVGITHVLIVAPELSVAIEGFRAVFQQVFWYFVLSQLIREQEDSSKIINFMIGMGLFLGLHATYQYIAKVPMPGNWVDVSENVRTRAFSIVGSPNILGCLFVLFIPMTISMLLTSKKRNLRAFYFISILFMTLGLFFTMSRGAWLAFAFSMFIFIMVINPKLILPFIALGGAFILFGGSLSERLLYVISPVYMMKSAAGGRLYRWAIGLDIWKRNKLFGVGLGRFGGAVAINNQLAPFYLDNYYLKTLTEMGIYGILGLAFVIICFIVFAAKIIRHQANMIKKLINIGLFASAIGVLTQNFVENIFEVPAMAIYFWVVVALINTYAPKDKTV